MSVSSDDEAPPPFNVTNMGAMRQILATSTALTDTSNRFEMGTDLRRPTDPQALKFFYDALDKLTGIRGSYDSDIIVVKQSLEILRSNPDDNDRCLAALESIMGVVDHIDVATDFAKLGGFSTIGQFLVSEDDGIVRTTSEIIGIATQNHPRCQERVLADENIFLNLFKILKSERDSGIKLKAVFAISSLIQNNKAGLDEFIKVNGYEVFMNLLKEGSLPLRLRTCFVIDCLCSQFPQIKSTLLENDYISRLVDLLTKVPIDESKETVLSAMLSLVEGCYDAVAECKKEEYNLIATLDYLLAHNKDQDEEKEKAIKLKAELNRFTK